MKIRVLNATLLLLTAFYIVQLSYVGSQYLMLNILDVNEVMMHFFYNSYIAPENNWWTKSYVLLITGIGTFSSFLVFFISLIAYIKMSRKHYRLQVLYLWLMAVSLSYIIGDFISAPFNGQYANMYNAMRWIGFADGGGGMYVVALLFLVTTPIIAYFINKPFFKTSNTTQFLKTKTMRLKYFFQIAIIPFFTLLFILFIMLNIVFSYEFNYILSREVMHLLSLAIILALSLFFSYNKSYISIYKENTFHHFDLALTLLIFFSLFSIFFLLFLNLDL